MTASETPEKKDEKIKSLCRFFRKKTTAPEKSVLKDEKVKFLYRFFRTRDIWLHFGAPFTFGILLIFLASVLRKEISTENIYLNSVFYLLETIAISFVVAAGFSYISSTEEFMGKIRKLLHDVVISRDFLSNIDTEGKKDVINRLIKPSSEEKKNYANIESYIESFVSRTLSITHKSVRSNYHVNAMAEFDEHEQLIRVSSRINYRLYPTSAGFKDIEIAFLAHEKKSKCKEIRVTTPSGKQKIISENHLKFEETNHAAGTLRMATLKNSEFNDSEPYLNIFLIMEEYGVDHWKHHCFCTLMPTDGFDYQIKCIAPVSIRHHQAFVFGANMHTSSLSENELNYYCSEWLNEGSGISIILGVPHKDNMPSLDLVELP